MQQDDQQLKKNTRILYSTLGMLQTPPLQGIAPRDSKKKKRKREGTSCFFIGKVRRLHLRTLKEMLRVERSTSTRKRTGYSWKERSSWRSKRTRDQLHGSELENTLGRLSRRYKRFEDVGEKLSERTNMSSCDVTIFSTPLTRITAPPNDDLTRFRRIAERSASVEQRWKEQQSH